MRRALLILLLLLCGAGPAQKRLLLQPSYEQLIRQHGPTLWLDASDPTTITATATAVSQWSDKSGNARHFVQATGANQPTLLTSFTGINGRSAVRFDGAASYMTSAATTGDVFAAGAKTQFIVYRSSSTGYLFTNAGTARWYGYIDATPDLNLVNSDGTADLAVSALAAHNLSHIGQALHSAGNIYAGIDGSLSAATASGDTAALTNALWIGARSDSSNWYTGDIAELLTFNKVLPSDVRIKIERGLCRKWGADC